MSYARDLSCITCIAEAHFVRAIGWLDATRPFTRGSMAIDFVDKLHTLSLLCDESELALGWPIMMGIHTCEFCEEFSASGNLGIPGDGVLYVAPEMIAHYVIEHGYAPPREFVEAVLRCPLPGTPAYARAICNFANSHPPGWIERR